VGPHNVTTSATIIAEGTCVNHGCQQTFAGHWCLFAPGQCTGWLLCLGMTFDISQNVAASLLIFLQQHSLGNSKEHMFKKLYMIMFIIWLWGEYSILSLWSSNLHDFQLNETGYSIVTKFGYNYISNSSTCKNQNPDH